LKIDSSLIDPPIRRFPLNLVGFYVWRRITRATHESSETLDYPSIASRLGSSRLTPKQWRRRRTMHAREHTQGRCREREEMVKRQDYLCRSRNRAAVPMNSNAEGSTRLFPKIHLRQRFRWLSHESTRARGLDRNGRYIYLDSPKAARHLRWFICPRQYEKL
jgi:hypothetical protein